MATQRKGPITKAARHAQQQRKHGVGAKCRDCGTSDHRVLVYNSRPKRCEECYRRHTGRSVYDAHHIAGRANSDVTIALPANVHRVLTDAQNDWEDRTMENPDRDPLLIAAGSVRGFRETLQGVCDWVIAMLEALSAWLRQTYGDRWWIGTPVERWSSPE